MDRGSDLSLDSYTLKLESELDRLGTHFEECEKKF